MARAMEKSAARRLSGAAHAQGGKNVRGKAAKPARPIASKSAAAKVIKVVPPAKVASAAKVAKKAGPSVRPPAPVLRPGRPVVAAVAPVRVEAARVNGSEHGVAVSRTDHLKARFAALSSATAQVKALKRALPKNFFEIGGHLAQIRDEKLYEVKGYGSFDSFVEREVDLDKSVCLRLARLSRTFVREAALEVGIERALAAMAALDGELAPGSSVAVYPVNSTVSNSLPAHKR
jgi:hypothetical protein